MLNPTKEFFPYSSYYPNQKPIMENIYAALDNGRLFLLEGACGTGKTLTALAPALAVASQKNKLVIICTNVNQQKKQFIEEARQIKKKAGINVIVLESKKSLCYHNQKIIEEIIDDEDEDENGTYPGVDYDDCKKLKAADKCTPFLRITQEDKKAKLNLKEKFDDWLQAEVRSPQDLAQWGKENKACVYSLALQSLEYVDLVICNTTLILNPFFLDVFKSFSKKGLEDYIIIFDEAHNIEKVARDIYKAGVAGQTLIASEKEIDEVIVRMANYFDQIKADKHQKLTEQDFIRLSRAQFKLSIEEYRYLSSFLKKFNKIITNLDLKGLKSDPTTGGQIYQISDPKKLHTDRKDILKNQLLKKFTEAKLLEIYEMMKTAGGYIDRQKAENDDDDSVSDTTSVARFLYAYMVLVPNNIGYYPYFLITDSSNCHIKIRLSLPDVITAPVLNQMFAGVLMSATLNPFEALEKVLGITRMTIPHTEGLNYPVENRKTYVIGWDRSLKTDWIGKKEMQPYPDILTFENKGNPLSELYKIETIRGVIEGTDGSVLIFFKNKEEAKKYGEILKHQYGDRLFINGSNENTNELLGSYINIARNHKNPILCTYIGGTLAEGVDFKDDLGRAVLIVGIGYPYEDILMSADITAYQEKFNGNTKMGREFVQIFPTIRKVRQAMGRIIRSNKDYGVRVLADGRYGGGVSGSISKHFPEIERKEIIKGFHFGQIKGLLINDFKKWKHSKEAQTTEK